MITELEKEFFDTFGIEPISKWHKCKDYSCVCCDEYDNCAKREFIYPEITDRRLLEMICIYNEYQNNYDYLVVPINIKTFKNDFFKIMIKSANDKYMNKYYCNDVEKLKTNIQQLFKEELK